ncbi:MAG: hypothetical protein U1C46_03380 [Bacteroidales bacterium]|nr:hypothetical protein [Bacteroidales bacterium]
MSTRHKFPENNPGRPEGALNKKTVEQKNRAEKILQILDATILTDLKSLNPKDRVNLYVDLMEYVHPRLQRYATGTPLGEEKVQVFVQEYKPGEGRSWD